MSDTLCLSCAKCYGGCPWSERDPETKRIKFQPVPGWTAEPTWKRGCGASYHVTACPPVCERWEGLCRWPGPEAEV